MKNDIVYNKFTIFLEDYKEYLLTNEEVWYNNLEKVIEYIKENNKLPSSNDKDKEIQTLGHWLQSQKSNYKLKKYNMKDNNIYYKFKDFLETRQIYFISNEDIWNNNLEKVIKYINENNKLPSRLDEDIEIKYLNKWIHHQKQKLKKQENNIQYDINFNKFKNFIETYKKYFRSN